jgi:hypothetical protein
MENIGFTGINYEWFIGQVPPNQTLDKTSVDGWGDRVKVRIIGRHNKSGSITPDEKLPWAIVERPTTQGNASRGSTGLTGGEWVRGYYLDPFKQVPVIVSVLARGTYENNVPLTVVKERKSTEFENVTRYNAFGPHAGQRLGADKPEQSASISSDSKPTKQEFEKAKEIPQDQEDITKNKQSQNNNLISQLSPQERAEQKLLLRSLQKGELGSGPTIDKAIQDIINQLNGVRGLVRDA